MKKTARLECNGVSRVICFILAAVVLVACALGQVTTARLEGIVKDASGAIVPGVTVTTQKLGTSLSYVSTTNEVGKR